MDQASLPKSITGISHSGFYVQDLDRTAEFYTKVLGAPTWEDGGYTGWSLGDSGIMIGEHSEVKGRSADPSRVMWNFETDDVKGDYETLKARGAIFLTPPVDWGGEIRCFFRDPDGHLLEISQAT